jgi:hypothetical protein
MQPALRKDYHTFNRRNFMRSNDNKPADKYGAEDLLADMEIMELCVDEQAHVAGGAIDTFLKVGTIKGES